MKASRAVFIALFAAGHELKRSRRVTLWLVGEPTSSCRKRPVLLRRALMIAALAERNPACNRRHRSRSSCGIRGLPGRRCSARRYARWNSASAVRTAVRCALALVRAQQLFTLSRREIAASLIRIRARCSTDEGGVHCALVLGGRSLSQRQTGVCIRSIASRRIGSR